MLGAESVLVKIIHNITKLKFKENGDPSGIRAFFKANNLDSKLLVRLVGNRFHVLFELAGNIYFIRSQLKNYIRDCCGEAYRQQIAHYLDIVEIEIVVCGLFGKCLTGPWMTVLSDWALDDGSLLQCCLIQSWKSWSAEVHG